MCWDFLDKTKKSLENGSAKVSGALGEHPVVAPEGLHTFLSVALSQDQHQEAWWRDCWVQAELCEGLTEKQHQE